ncbi:hypothetical protein BJX99DRAFT_46760 [Aspergillus californicus]
MPVTQNRHRYHGPERMKMKFGVETLAAESWRITGLTASDWSQYTIPNRIELCLEAIMIYLYYYVHMVSYYYSPTP